MRRNLAFWWLAVWIAAPSWSTAQDVVPNLLPLATPERVVFTPDVGQDLAQVTRIRVELTFQGDAWTFVDARTEPGVPSTYPDTDGFLRAAILNATGEPLASIGLPDPRVLHLYELRVGREVGPGRPGPAEEPVGIDRPQVAPTAVKPPGLVTRPRRAEPPATDRREPPPRIDMPGWMDRQRRTFGGDRFEGPVPREDATLRFQRLQGALTLPERQRPPHQDVLAAEGTLIVYLPDRPGACTVRITIASVTTPITLTRPLLDLEGQAKTCR